MPSSASRLAAGATRPAGGVPEVPREDERHDARGEPGKRAELTRAGAELATRAGIAEHAEPAASAEHAASTEPAASAASAELGSPIAPAVDSSWQRPGVSADAARRPSQSATIEVIGAQLRRLHVTVQQAFIDKLEAARAALSHANPGASIERILEAGLDLILQGHAKKKGLVKKPRAIPRPSNSKDYIPAHVSREVWARDAGCCQWPLERGGVCGSTDQLEFDHKIPRARGGPSTVENVRVLCRFHNQLAARKAFGSTFIDKVVASVKRRRGKTAGNEPSGAARVGQAAAGNRGPVEAPPELSLGEPGDARERRPPTAAQPPLSGRHPPVVSRPPSAGLNKATADLDRRTADLDRRTADLDRWPAEPSRSTSDLQPHTAAARAPVPGPLPLPAEPAALTTHPARRVSSG